jgi:hypothetical protein
MPVKLNSEFNYRYQVIGETPWEKIKTLKGFLEGRIRAAALEKVADLKYQALVSEVEHLIRIDALPHVILNKQAELLEAESHQVIQTEAFELNRQEIEILKRLLAELYEIAERIPGYTDEQMFEANAANEFTVSIGKDIQAEIIVNGRPSPAKLRNAMSNPHTFAVLQAVGLVPKEAVMLESSNSALRIELNPKIIS